MVLYVDGREFAAVFRNPDFRFAMRLSLWTSTLSAFLAVVTAIPVGYVLARKRFPGRTLLDSIVDIPIVLPPVVMGLCLLVFFRTPLGEAMEDAGLRFVYHASGIVLAQYFSITPYAVRTVKAAVENLNPRIEEVARTLGYTRGRVFWRVTLPMIKNGVIAGGVIAWAVAIGLFGPMMILVGTTRQRTEVLATSIYLELSVGRIQTALAIALVMIAMALVALTLFKKLTGGDRNHA
ncbi:MAG: ABC transporter permease subunit, partial [Phycisphaerae bacterium]|nr:ABC transporter permease subunit [Phycisphaerae bacterium]